MSKLELMCNWCGNAQITKTDDSIIFDCASKEAKDRAAALFNDANTMEKFAENILKFSCQYFKDKTNDKATTEKAQEEKD